jgi:bla regulator protein blaR1
MHAVLTHLYQSTMLAAAAWLATILLRNRSAGLRHWLWMAASVKFLVPFSLLVAVGADIAPRIPMPPAASHISPAIAAIAAPLTLSQIADTASAPPASFDLVPGIWFAGFVAVAWRRSARYQRSKALVSGAARVPLRFPVEVRYSPSRIEPGVFGIFRPVVLLPEGIARHLAPAHLHAILSHELCHVRRHDNLRAAIHMVVETIFWFHSLVWFVGARLVEERERACDEDVVRRGSDPEIYAESILSACRLYLQPPSVCVSAVTGADLRKRIEHIMTGRLPGRLGRNGQLLLAAAAFFAVACPLVVGLLSAQEDLAFEAASVKANRSGGPMGRIGSPSPGRFRADNSGLQFVAATAYDVNIDQISGWPEWALNEHFDIDAKAAHPVTAQQLHAMLRALLAERFRFRVRRETRQEQVYGLAIDRRGPKLKEHATASEPARGDRMPIRPGGKGEVIFQGVPMSRLAWFLGTRLNRPLIDRTGLAGSYDFELLWDGERMPMGPDGAPVLDSLRPSIFTAVREQLGLRLEPEKGPVEYLTVEHLERPTEN